MTEQELMIQLDQLIKDASLVNRNPQTKKMVALDDIGMAETHAKTEPPDHPAAPSLAEIRRKRIERREGQHRKPGANASLRDVLDYLRVCINYQAYDLECTRRERDELREKQ